MLMPEPSSGFLARLAGSTFRIERSVVGAVGAAAGDDEHAHRAVEDAVVEQRVERAPVEAAALAHGVSRSRSPSSGST